MQQQMEVVSMPSGNQFGPFIRELRKALGLSLREFCRQSGFDQGNVSRMERGLTPPPQTPASLKTYAKALKLEQGTERWNQLVSLAAAAGQLPQFMRQLRRGPGHWNWVTARHLEQWANALEARAILPQLIRRLVHATGKTITRIGFPSGEQIQRPGLDGDVVATDPDAFVPAGRSAWEIGVTKDPAEKAEADFAKRRRQKLGFDKKIATYIVVTPRKWQTKGTWIAEKSKLGVWKEVRVYDSAALEEWLERAPAVDVWLARLLELRPEGLSDIEEYWKNLQELTEPSLKPEVFLASRRKQVEEFKSWLAGPASAAVIETRSPSEAVDFVSAFIHESSECEAVTARALIVEKKEAWRAISRADSKLILIAHPNLVVEPDMVAEAIRQGHHVVLATRQSLADQAFTLELPRVKRYDLQKALVSSGLKQAKAREHSDRAGGSLTVLKRLLGKIPGTITPVWSRQPDASALVPFLLAGAWEDTNKGDREALEQLSGQPYQEISKLATRWLDETDSPLTRVLSRWRLISRDDSWLWLAHAVTPEHIQGFEQLTLDVLGENDPAFELLPDDRWMANIKNKNLGYSQLLRTGLAETLVLLSSRPARLPNPPEISAQIEHIAFRLLDRKDWQRWASLSPQLPLIAEAAPEAFLKAVEQDLRQTDPVLPKLFNQKGESVMFISDLHTGLLWALEGLAWNKNLLPQVCYLLARLDELISEKNSGNSPMTSLLEIFMPWLPQTTAPVEERVKILAEINRKNPETGWRLLLGLIPDRVRTASPIRTPAFRDWAVTWKEGTTNADYWRLSAACSGLLVDLLGKDLRRWKDLIEHFENLVEPAREKFLDKLQSFDVSAFDTESRRIITGALKKKVTRHRRFRKEDWALTEAILIQLEKAAERIEPEDVVSKNLWLFNQISEELARENGKEEKEIAEIRRSVIREVGKAAGWNGILALVEAVRLPEEIGLLVGETGSAKDDSRVLPSLLNTASEKLGKFARSYVWCRFKARGWEWIKQKKLSELSALDVAEIALVLPSEQQTWDLVAGKGKKAEEHYWKNTFKLVDNPNPEKLRFPISMLLKYGRPFQACFVLHNARQKECPLEPGLVMEVLEAGINRPTAESERAMNDNRQHYLLELIQYLQNEVQQEDSRVEMSRAAKIEWGYLELLDGDAASPETLLSMLSSYPAFFVDLLRVIYRSKRDPDDAEFTEIDKDRAQNAYRLLMSWHSVPGSRYDGTVDGDAMLDWIHKARSMAEEQDRLEVCDLQIGDVFAQAPNELSDSSWPCIPVRDAIEEIGTDALADGFEVGILNKRGAYTKALDEGGNQERDLAKDFFAWSEASRIEWPKTAAALRRVGELYEARAQREDAEADAR